MARGLSRKHKRAPKRTTDGASDKIAVDFEDARLRRVPHHKSGSAHDGFESTSSALSSESETDTDHFDAMGLAGASMSDNAEDDEDLVEEEEEDLIDEDNHADQEDAYQDWGKRASEYYDGDVDQDDHESDDDEDIELQHEEAVKLQKKMIEQSLAAGCLIDDALESADTKTKATMESFEGDFHQKVKSILAGLGTLVQLGKEGKEELHSEEDIKLKLDKEHPEFLPLIDELKSRSTELTEYITPFLKSFRTDAQFRTNEGLNYLEMRSHLLMCYLQYLCYYVLLKLNGVSIRNHPVLDRLIEIRVLMTQLKPIEERIQPQVQRLLDNPKDSVLRPRPELLVDDANDDLDSLHLTSGHDESEDEKMDSFPIPESLVYKPPNIMAVRYTDATTQREEKNKQKQDSRREKFLLNSDAMKAFREEFDDAPMEIEDATTADMSANALTKRLLENQKARAQYEEETMSRLPVSKALKKERKQLNEKRRALLTNENALNDLSNFSTQVYDVKLEDPTLSTLGREEVPKLSSALDTLNKESNKKRRREAERNHFMTPDAHVNSKIIKPRMKQTEAVGHFGGGSASDDDSNAFDQEIPQIVKDAVDRKKAKKEWRSKQRQEEALQALPPLDPTVADKRKVGYAIEKNKGLVRKRRKVDGNARVKNREKYQKKIKSWKTLQQPVRETHSSGNYHGETTGIKTHVKKSVTFAS